MTVQIFANINDLGRAAAELTARLSAAEASAARGIFTVAMSGGSLPKLIAPGLLAANIDWSSWRVFFADERCVPLDHPDSNYRLALELLFGPANLPAGHIFPINPALSPAAAADDYQTKLRQVFGDALPRFDLILLGMGEDGHTASLFPGHLLLSETTRNVAPIFNSPKPPPERITLTLPVLNAARHVAFVAAGAGKADVLPQVLAPGSALPAGLVQPASGQLTWFVDEAAARRLG